MKRPGHLFRKARHYVEGAALAVGVPAAIVANVIPETAYDLVQKLF